MFDFYRKTSKDIQQKQDYKDLAFGERKWEKAYLWIKDGDLITDKEEWTTCISSIYGAFDSPNGHNAFKEDMFLYEVDALCRKWEYILWSFYGKHADKVKNYRKLNWDEFKDVLFRLYPSVESKSDFKTARKLGYDNFAFLKYCAAVIELGETEDFARITYKPGIDHIKKLKMLHRENVSRDNMIYLLTK